MQATDFFQQALIYLCAAVITVPIAARFGLGSVLGFLIAGIAIGPWGFKFINNVAAIMHIAEFGVVLLLFIIGLELNSQQLWRLRQAVFGLGSLQIIITTFIFTALLLLIKPSFIMAFVMALGLTMSSTAMVLQTLMERKILSTPLGQSSIAILLCQDLLVIPIIIFLSFYFRENTDHINYWFNLAEACLVIVLVIFSGRYLLRYILRYIASTGLRELFIAFALLLVIGTAILMRAVGLPMATGTFLAGLLLADSEYRYQLEIEIEPFKGLLLGLFFMTIGMSLNIGLFIDHLLLVLGIVLAIVVIKTVILYWLARYFKETANDAKLFAIYLSQIGEFAFVIFGLSYQVNLFTKLQMDFLNDIVAISMISTPFLLLLYYKYFDFKQSQPSPQNHPDISEKNKVIIAGYGRVGGIISRLLNANGIKTTVIDQDVNQIELIHKFGGKGYYGDISRLDLLQAAGASQAKLLILAIDDSDASMATIKLIKQYFPHLKIIVRARGRIDAFEFLAEDIPCFRETFDCALAMSEGALKILGYTAEHAKAVVKQFERHDILLLHKGVAHRYDQKRLISLAQQGRLELAKLLEEEAKLHH